MQSVKPTKSPNIEVLSADFRITATEPSNLPPPLYPEVVFFGRSNVGKSSLLNTLSGRKSLARTSKQPGRTQALNFFDLKLRSGEQTGELTFVDAPGFGFAKVARGMRGQWEKLLSAYLSDKKRLSLGILLVDCRRDLKGEESWIVDSVPKEKLILVATKSDKLNQKEKAAAKKRLGAVSFISSHSGEGMARVQKEIFERLFSASLS